MNIISRIYEKFKRTSQRNPQSTQKLPKSIFKDPYKEKFLFLPGEPEYGVKDVGGVVEPPGCAPKKPPGEAMEGGEAGDEGPPLEVFGGLMRFSFCRLLKNIEVKR